MLVKNSIAKSNAKKIAANEHAYQQVLSLEENRGNKKRIMQHEKVIIVSIQDGLGRVSSEKQQKSTIPSTLFSSQEKDKLQGSVPKSMH